MTEITWYTNYCTNTPFCLAIPWTCRVLPPVTACPYSSFIAGRPLSQPAQVSSSEYNGNLDTVDLTTDHNSNLPLQPLSECASLSAMKWRLRAPTLGKSVVLLDRLASDRRAPLLTWDWHDPSRPQAPSYHWPRLAPGRWRCTTGHTWGRWSWELLGCWRT